MIRLTAHAKINWYLEITGKRPDGYHTLETVFQTIALGDELTFEPSDTIVVSCSNASLPVDERNLVTRAAFRLREALGETRGARIHLEKISPMGAGLGGGSADAAAALKGLLQLWGKTLPEDRLKVLAVSLGADVPFFLTGGLCLGTGIGEVLSPLPALPKTWMVVVWPGFGVPTKDAYARVKLPFSEAAPKRAADPRTSLFNRFESLVFPAYPALEGIKRDVREAGATASLMSGSGSAVFGLVPGESEGRAALANLKKKYPHSWLTHTL